MASRREIVMFTGHLTGMGREIECSVTLVKVSLPGTTKFNYVRPVIYGTPDYWPDGPYSLTFDGQTTTVRRLGGAWIAPAPT